MSAVALPDPATAAPPAPAPPVTGRRRAAGPLFAVALAALGVAVAVHATGGQLLGRLTLVEIVLQLLGGLTLVVAVLTVPAEDRTGTGALVVGLMALLAADTALSIVWAVNPSQAWLEANLTFTYLMVLAAGVALVRIAPARWPSLAGATVIVAVVLSGDALLTEVFPSWLSPDETYARLREPFGYWNAVGLSAVMGIPGCLWWGTRRAGRGVGRAIAAPLLALLVLTVLLAYSRGSLLAAGVAITLWLVLVPLRLRSAALLLVGGVGAGLVAVWAFGQEALSEDRVPVDARDVAGHRLGLLILVMLLVVFVAYAAIIFRAEARPLRAATRRRLGIGLLVAVALVPLGGAVGLAASSRGLTGSISHSWTQLTSPKAASVPNDPSRLTAVGNVRSRYWNEALKIFKANPVLGVGAGGYDTVRPRYRQDQLQVRHAHGYGVQTLSDLGAVGMAISLGLLAAWLVAAWRALDLRRPRTRWDEERVGLAALAAVVVTFGVHSFVDWTWFIPGTAVPALLCAGWVAGRGRPATPPPGAPAPLRAGLRDGLRGRWRIAAALLLLLLTGALVWNTWQPLRAVQADDATLAALGRGDVAAAQTHAEQSRARNPLSIDPLIVQSVVDQRAGRVPGARADLQRAVRLQPGNPQSWLALAEFELKQGRAQAALTALGPALFLDQRSPQIQAAFLAARRAADPAAAAPAAPPAP